jgi:hypothetical protein
MTIRQEILQAIQEFLTKEAKTKKDYRTFLGNCKRLCETPRIKDLSQEELTICQQTQVFLQNWQDNYFEHPTVLTKEKDLELTRERFQE